jgi:hypothetical protein
MINFANLDSELFSSQAACTFTLHHRALVMSSYARAPERQRNRGVGGAKCNSGSEFAGRSGYP